MKALIVPFPFAILPKSLAIVVLLAGLLALAVQAQSDACPSSPALRKALWQPYRSSAEISVGLSDPILVPQTATWRIIDTKDGSLVPVRSVKYPPISGQHYALSALIVPERTLAIDHIYYLLVDSIVFEHCTAPPHSI